MAHDILEARSSFSEGSQVPILVDQLLVLESLLNNDLKGIAIQRFEDIVEGPELHGGYCVADGAISGHQDDGNLRHFLAQACEQVHATQARHLDVRDYYIAPV